MLGDETASLWRRKRAENLNCCDKVTYETRETQLHYNPPVATELLQRNDCATPRWRTTSLIVGIYIRKSSNNGSMGTSERLSGKCILRFLIDATLQCHASRIIRQEATRANIVMREAINLIFQFKQSY